MNKSDTNTTAINIDATVFNKGSVKKSTNLISARINPIVDKTEIDLVAGFGNRVWGQAHAQAWGAWAANL